MSLLGERRVSFEFDRAMQSFGGYKRLVGIESSSKPIQRHVVEAAGL